VTRDVTEFFIHVVRSVPTAKKHND